jgi:hypothetical protein
MFVLLCVCLYIAVSFCCFLFFLISNLLLILCCSHLLPFCFLTTQGVGGMVRVTEGSQGCSHCEIAPAHALTMLLMLCLPPVPDHA